MPAKIAHLSVCAVLLALGCLAPLSAQSLPDAEPSADAVAMAAALKLRGNIAQAVAADTTRPDEALAQLRAENSPSGLRIEADADFAYAAIDVGRRLVAAGKPAEAEEFFRAAEQSLATLVQRTADTQARDKAQYLRRLSLIRGSYLNKADQARRDIDQAIALQPDDKGLQRARETLARSNAQIFPATPKG